MITFQERIRRERSRMSKGFARLADFLLDSYVQASFMTAGELAQRLNLDPATVVRFAQHLGYQGYPQLQQEIREQVKSEILLRPAEAEASQTAFDAASAALHDLARDLEHTRQTLDASALERLIEAIGAARRILLSADPPAQPSAHRLAEALQTAGFSVYIAEPAAESLARLLASASPQDLFLAFDAGGKIEALARALKEAQERDIPTAVIAGTGSLASTLYASILLTAQPRSPHTAPAVLVHALADALLQALRWRFRERFASIEASLKDLIPRLQEGTP